MLLDDLKNNLVDTPPEDDDLLTQFISAAVDYAQEHQHLPAGYYNTHEMPPATRQAVIMLATHFYESRDGSTAGFFSDNPAAAQQTWTAVHRLLNGGKEWMV